MAFSLTSCSPLPVWWLDGNYPSLLVQKLPFPFPYALLQGTRHPNLLLDEFPKVTLAQSDPGLEQVTELRPV